MVSLIKVLKGAHHANGKPLRVAEGSLKVTLRATLKGVIKWPASVVVFFANA